MGVPRRWKPSAQIYTFGLGSSDPGFLPEFAYNADGAITTDDYEQFGNRFGTSL